MGCCGNNIENCTGAGCNDGSVRGYSKPRGSSVSKRVVGLTERSLRLRTCVTCPNRIKAGDAFGVNKRDYCDWDKKKIRDKVKSGDEVCYKGIWPVFEAGTEPGLELSNVEKLGLLLHAGVDMVNGSIIDDKDPVLGLRRDACLTCIHRIPKRSDTDVYDPNMIQETDICGICTCPVLSMTKLMNKVCPDVPSKWGKYSDDNTNI